MVYRYTDSARFNPAAGRSYIKGSYRPPHPHQLLPLAFLGQRLSNHRILLLPPNYCSAWPVPPNNPPLTVSVVRSHLDNTRPTTSILDWRMQLNNFLQVNGGAARLKYIEVVSGPAHKPVWRCTAYSKFESPPCDVCLDFSLVDDVPYAEGSGGEKGEARENAARNCYLILRPQ